MYTSEGIIKIEEGLELESPTARIYEVRYNCPNAKVIMEVYFSEGNYTHSRFYTFPCEVDDMTFPECEDLLFTLPLFSDNFTR